MFGDWINPDVDPFTSTRKPQPVAASYSAFKVAENESPLPLDRLNFAAATPVTSPRLFDAEALARFNWRF
jgi:hypothetical protein